MPTQLSESEKLELFKAGKYRFPPPPVCPEQWFPSDWIRYIDNHGIWCPTMQVKNYGPT